MQGLVMVVEDRFIVSSKTVVKIINIIVLNKRMLRLKRYNNRVRAHAYLHHLKFCIQWTHYQPTEY